MASAAMSSSAEFVIKVLLVNEETRAVRLDERTEVTVSETGSVCSPCISVTMYVQVFGPSGRRIIHC